MYVRPTSTRPRPCRRSVWCSQWSYMYEYHRNLINTWCSFIYDNWTKAISRRCIAINVVKDLSSFASYSQNVVGKANYDPLTSRASLGSKNWIGAAMFKSFQSLGAFALHHTARHLVSWNCSPLLRLVEFITNLFWRSGQPHPFTRGFHMSDYSASHRGQMRQACTPSPFLNGTPISVLHSCSCSL